jgi:hypothetical protein
VTETLSRPETSTERRASTRPWAAAVGAVILAIALISILSPDLVTGAFQEHIPIVGLTAWLWGAVAIGYLTFVRGSHLDVPQAGLIAGLWLAIAATCIFSPELVTGTDPTRIPIAGLVAPVVGTVVTGFLCLHALRD